MPRLDIPGDVRRVFDVIKDGGVAIWPNDVGYGMIGGTTQALKKIFHTKKRGSHKRNALIGDAITQREVHRLDQRSQDIIETITIDYNLPLGVIAPCNIDHPLLRKVDPELLEASTANGTIAMLLNAGLVYNELTRLSREEVQPLFGSSANLSGTGQRFRADDLQPEIRNAADIVLDYGLQKYHHYGRSVTIMRFPEVEVVRIGTCYELIVDAVRREYGIELPADPGRDVLPSGHLKEFELAKND